MEGEDKLDHQEQKFRNKNGLGLFKHIGTSWIMIDQLTVCSHFKFVKREDMVAQGIELQRRRIREIKVRVEQERGGRLAKLDDLPANLKCLQCIAFDNSSYLDENIRLHTLWDAI